MLLDDAHSNAASEAAALAHRLSCRYATTITERGELFHLVFAPDGVLIHRSRNPISLIVALKGFESGIAYAQAREEEPAFDGDPADTLAEKRGMR